jgi:hypothetical protein
MPLNRKVFPDHLKVLLIELPSPPLYSLAGLAGSHDTTARLEGGGLILPGIKSIAAGGGKKQQF